MALPAHLAQYEDLVDIIVEALVREAEEVDSENEKPAASWQTSPRVEVLQDGNRTAADIRAAIQT